jgi:hypothetical protein
MGDSTLRLRLDGIRRLWELWLNHYFPTKIGGWARR